MGGKVIPQLEKQPMKFAVASVRRSSYNQEGNQSFEIQKLAIQDFVKKKGYYLPDDFIFYDEATSAYKKSASSRSGLSKMKEVVLTEDVDAIIFYDFSRIDRKIYSFVSEFYYEVISKKPHLKFFTTTKENEWTPADLDVKLQLIIANAESNDKSRRAVDSQRKDLSPDKKERPGSTVPYGYKQVGKKLIPSEAEAAIVLLIFYLSSWGYSLQKIVDVLNDAEVPSPKMRKWRTSTIENIIKNPVYMGQLSWNFKQRHLDKKEIVHEHAHESIVPKMLYQLIEVNRSLKQKFNKLETPFKFGGLLTCTGCGNELQHRNCSTKKNGTKYSYLKYFCSDCSYEIEVNTLNEKLFTHIEKQFSMSMKINIETVTGSLSEYLLSLKRSHEKLIAKEQLILANERVALLEKDTQVISIFRNAKQKIGEQLCELQDSIKAIEELLHPAQLSVFLNNFQEITLSKLSSNEQRLILLYFIREIPISMKDDVHFQFEIHFKLNPVSFLTNSVG